MRNSQIVSSTTEELSKHPTLVISLDFEKGWGLNNTDPKKIEQKIFNLRLEDKVVSRILTAAAINDIAITWATVGAIGLKNTTDFKAYCDDVSYKDIRYFDIPFDLIEKIKNVFLIAIVSQKLYSLKIKNWPFIHFIMVFINTTGIVTGSCKGSCNRLKKYFLIL